MKQYFCQLLLILASAQLYSMGGIEQDQEPGITFIKFERQDPIHHFVTMQFGFREGAQFCEFGILAELITCVSCQHAHDADRIHQKESNSFFSAVVTFLKEQNCKSVFYDNNAPRCWHNWCMSSGYKVNHFDESTISQVDIRSSRHQ